MSKLLPIENCYECKFHTYTICIHPVCQKETEYIWDIDNKNWIIPDWCPLEDINNIDSILTKIKETSQQNRLDLQTRYLLTIFCLYQSIEDIRTVELMGLTGLDISTIEDIIYDPKFKQVFQEIKYNK